MTRERAWNQSKPGIAIVTSELCGADSLDFLIKQTARRLKLSACQPIMAEKERVGLHSVISPNAVGPYGKPYGKMCAVVVCACVEHCSLQGHSPCVCSQLTSISST